MKTAVEKRTSMYAVAICMFSRWYTGTDRGFPVGGGANPGGVNI